MKKIKTIAFLFVLISLNKNSYAQSNNTEFGKTKTESVTETYLSPVLNVVGTGFNYGKSNNELSDYKKPVFGGQAGVSFQGGITPKFSLLIEFYFMMKGGKLDANNPLTGGKTTLRLYTVELPVLARFHFGNFYVNAGPSIAYNVYGTRKIEGSSKESLFNNSQDSFNRWDAGIQVGAGYRFKVKQRNMGLDVRYSNGLTNISKGNLEVYNNYLNVSLYIFNPWNNNPLSGKKK